jgi:hypothetical protein
MTTLTDAEKRQAEEERRRARIYAEEEAAVLAKQKEDDRANSVSRMSAQEFAQFKREEFHKTEQRQREAEKKAAAEQANA